MGQTFFVKNTIKKKRVIEAQQTKQSQMIKKQTK